MGKPKIRLFWHQFSSLGLLCAVENIQNYIYYIHYIHRNPLAAYLLTKISLNLRTVGPQYTQCHENVKIHRIRLYTCSQMIPNVFGPSRSKYGTFVYQLRFNELQCVLQPFSPSAIMTADAFLSSFWKVLLYVASETALYVGEQGWVTCGAIKQL